MKKVIVPSSGWKGGGVHGFYQKPAPGYRHSSTLSTRLRSNEVSGTCRQARLRPSLYVKFNSDEFNFNEIRQSVDDQPTGDLDVEINKTNLIFCPSLPHLPVQRRM